MPKLASSLSDLPDKYFLQVMVHCPFDFEEEPHHPGTLYDALAERCFKSRRWSTKSLAYVIRQSRQSDDAKTPAERKKAHEFFLSYSSKADIKRSEAEKRVEAKRWRAIFAIGLDHVSKKASWQKDVEAFLKFFRKEEGIEHEDFTTIGFYVYCATSDRLRFISWISPEYDMGRTERVKSFMTDIYRIATKTVPTRRQQEKEWAEQQKKYYEESKRQEAKEKSARDRKRKKRGLGEVGTGRPAKTGKIFSAFYNPAEDIKEWFDFSDPNDKGWQQLAKLRENHEKQLYREMPRGGTRIGGLPHVPAGFKWPHFRRKALPFVAQLDLAGVESGSQGLLPKTGFLLFFALISNSERTTPVVRFFQSARKQLKLATPPKRRWKDWVNNEQYDLLAMSKFIGPGEKSRRKKAKVAELFGQPELSPDLPGHTAEHECLDGIDWITLLTVYSHDKMQWSDCGELHFFARRSDLEECNFDNVLTAIYSG